MIRSRTYFNLETFCKIAAWFEIIMKVIYFTFGVLGIARGIAYRNFLLFAISFFVVAFCITVIYISCGMITGIYEKDHDKVRHFRDLCIFQVFNVTLQTCTGIIVAVVYGKACLIGFVLLHFVICMECNVCFLVVVQYFYKKMGEEKYDSVEGLSVIE